MTIKWIATPSWVQTLDTEVMEVEDAAAVLAGTFRPNNIDTVADTIASLSACVQAFGAMHGDGCGKDLSLTMWTFGKYDRLRGGVVLRSPAGTSESWRELVRGAYAELLREPKTIRYGPPRRENPA